MFLCDLDNAFRKREIDHVGERKEWDGEMSLCSLRAVDLTQEGRVVSDRSVDSPLVTYYHQWWRIQTCTDFLYQKWMIQTCTDFSQNSLTFPVKLEAMSTTGNETS